MTNYSEDLDELFHLGGSSGGARPSHNRDDHSKNFTYLYNEEKGIWRLSPAYDLTYSHSIGGEHATCISGNGKNPAMRDILKVADYIGMSKEASKRIAAEIKEIVNEELGIFQV